MKKTEVHTRALDETVLMTEPAVGNASDDASYRRLLDNYAALLQAGEIHFPLSYRFTHRLGSGRQGVVFHALRHGARGCVTQHAIKVHDPAIYPNTEKYWSDMGRIASQISKLQKVSSPQLVSRDVYEEVNGIGYTQMEAVEGIVVQELILRTHFETVRARSNAGEWENFNDVIFSGIGIQPGVAFYIMRQALRGLEVLHKAGFLHSDIKPANMMIDRLGIVKLIDYGRAVRIDEKNTFLMGTPLYMAPELHRHEGASVQSDLYSIGLVGLEMLRGGPIEEMASLDEPALVKYKESLAERITGLLPNAVRGNQALLGCFRRFLHPDPAKRYASAADAEFGPDGLLLIHKQLARAGIDTEYDRELEKYVGKVLGGGPEPAPSAGEELLG